MDTAPAFSGGAEALAPRYDVAIVGAGFTGLSAAQVAVLEAGALGCGASGRNGGHLNNGMAHGYGAAMQRFGRDQARALYHLYDAAIEAVIEDEGIVCDFRRSGKLKFASKPGHVAALRASFELIHQEADADTVFLDRDALGAELRTEAAYAAMLYPKSPMMHMGRYLVGLAEAVGRHGADLFQHTPVTALGAGDGAWRMSTPKGPVLAGEVILAGGAGAATSGAFPSFARRIVPVGSFILATRPLTEAEIAATVHGDRTYVNTLNIGNYFRLSPDRRLIFGGRARFSSRSDPQVDQASARILRRQMERMFPALRGVAAAYCFGGLVDMTQDRLPRAGQLDGLWYAMGYSGHGAQLSTLLGARIAQCVLGAAQSPLGFLDWPVIPGHRGRPWFLPATGLYFKLKDLLR
jgi:glycine/D-amino acid oxidase-like deaminating enzyme